MTDVWVLQVFADLAAKCLFGPILGSFGGILTPKIVKLLFFPQSYALSAETRVLRYCALKSVQRSHL